MLRLKICRNQRGGLFLCNSGTQYNKIEDVWTDCIGTPWDKLYPEVTFENSLMEVELKLIEK
jgi:GH24 family phage-related lysozyme (muramidase)